MRKLAIPALLLALCACSSHPPIRSAAQARATGHGAIAVQLPHESVRARLGYENRYSFPLEMVVRETGGHPVQIARVSVKIMNASMRYSGGKGAWTAAHLRGTGG